MKTLNIWITLVAISLFVLGSTVFINCSASEEGCSSDDQCPLEQRCINNECTDTAAFDNIEKAAASIAGAQNVACPPDKDTDGSGCATSGPLNPGPTPPGYDNGAIDDDDNDDNDDVDDDDVDDDDVDDDDVDDDDDLKCTSDVDCMDGATPKCDAPTTSVCVCKDEQCVEGCLLDEDCPVTEPICNTTDKVCCNDPVVCPQVCATSADCIAYAGYTYCDTLQNPAICVELENCIKSCPAGMTLIWAGECDKAFCMDTYEASNDGNQVAQSVEGVAPWNEVAWDDAQAACEAAGKSLCTEEQWITACDGRFGLGKEREFSYGDDFTPGQCNDSNTEQPPAPVNCGAKPNCKTPENEFGGEVVYDLNGNVAEWVNFNRSKNPPYAIIGGRYSSACPDPSKQCELKCNNIFPLTDGNVERIGIGFRCCAEAQ